MAEASGACRRRNQFAGLFLGKRDELFNRIRRDRRMDIENGYRVTDLGNRSEGLEGVVRLFGNQRVENDPRRVKEKGIAVGGCVGDHLSGQGAAAPGLVFRNELFAETL